MSEQSKKKIWSPEDLEYFRNLIQDKRQESIKAIKRLEDSILGDEHKEGSSGSDSTYAYHMADVGTDAMEKEKDFLWLSREKKYLGHLNIAFDRLNRGVFGVCVGCGNLIPKERLEEVPHTQHCVTCKTKK